MSFFTLFEETQHVASSAAYVKAFSNYYKRLKTNSFDKVAVLFSGPHIPSEDKSAQHSLILLDATTI